MARKPATLGLSSNIELRASAPLDGRQKVETIADLTAPESFPYHFVGMETYCVEAQKWYTLRYDDPTNIDNWVENGSGRDGKDGSPIIVDSVTKQGRENIITLVWKDMYGADHSIDVTILDGQKGDSIVGPAGPQGEPGESFSIRSQYATEEELREHHPTGNSGDAYFVGGNETTPHLFFWNEELNDWDDLGEIIGTQGPKGDPGDDGFSPDITVAETADNSYKLRVTTATGSFVTPNLQGNLAPQDRIDTSANPVQSGTIKTALDAKQDKTLATAVGVRDYTDGVVKDQSTVQTTLEALAAAVNYIEIPAQLLQQVSSAESLPANAKPGSICVVNNASSEEKVTYICNTSGEWVPVGGGIKDTYVEITASEVDEMFKKGNISVVVELGEWDNVGYFSNGNQTIYDAASYVDTDGVHFIGGGGNASGYKSHYLWTGDEETKGEKLADIPYYIDDGSAIMFNNELHIFGGRNASGSSSDYSSNMSHFKYDGETWTRMPNLPFETDKGFAFIYNDELHLLQGDNNSSSSDGFGNLHYKWDGETWTKLDNTPFYSYHGVGGMFNGEPYFVKDALYKYNGTTWIKVSDLPNVLMQNGASFFGLVEYNNKLRLFTDYMTSNNKHHYSMYSWDGNTFDEAVTCPIYPHFAAVYNNKLMMFVQGGSNIVGYEYK